MTFITTTQLLALLLTAGLYKPWEKVARLVCAKYFDTELSVEICAACVITMFLVINTLLAIYIK